MRIGTVNTAAGPRAVVLDGNDHVVVDVTAKDLLGMSPAERDACVARSTETIAADTDALLPAIPDPGKILCIGRNYAAHAEELGAAPTKRPEVFIRTNTSLLAPFGAVTKPRISDRLDFEVELAVIIGRPGRRIDEASALDHVGGSAVLNDFTIRDWQRATTQWTPGKNFDGTAPLGPYVVTSDEIDDPASLDISLTVDGEVMQSSNTSMLIHSIPKLISFLSEFTTLEVGDVIATGTPGGVGDGRDPKRFLVAGETVVSTIESVGELRNVIIDEQP